MVNHLSQLGLSAVGYDISEGQLAEACRAFPHLEFGVGDLTSLHVDDASLGGIVARYSIIHLRPSQLETVFREWWRVLEPGAPVLISFFGAASAGAHGTAFDHAVVTAHALHPATMARQLAATGFVDVGVGALPPEPGGRPFDRATVIASKPDESGGAARQLRNGSSPSAAK